MALYSIGYSSDDFLSGAKAKSGDPVSIVPKDDLTTTQEWEITDQPASGHNNKRLVIIRHIKSQHYLAVKKQRDTQASPKDQVILTLDADDDNELVMDALWVEDRLTAALQPKKGQTQTWSVTRH
ncbi:hypothetical protein BGZ70_007772 [Mortierella alpina]|uniref:Uncharacterized protein n=1 Tax=Mortierella alpina TaxID=64518 RepID=A0A9P6JDT2_MORAP|nr:hypothetical protein BGZ70_007772 [Mortierella alpina]